MNHGSYGAMSLEVWQEFLYWQKLKNNQPVHFYGRIYPEAIELTTQKISLFLGSLETPITFNTAGPAA